MATRSRLVKALIGLATAFGLLLLALVLGLWLKPPDILRSAQLLAKIVCSNVFLAAAIPTRCCAATCKLPALRCFA